LNFKSLVVVLPFLNGSLDDLNDLGFGITNRDEVLREYGEVRTESRSPVVEGKVLNHVGEGIFLSRGLRGLKPDGDSAYCCCGVTSVIQEG
jgi:hypothetical protein